MDISELADSMTGDGKVIGCDNSGEIYADSQGGGIIGSISMETVKNAGKKILDLGSETMMTMMKMRMITATVLPVMYGSCIYVCEIPEV